MIDETFVKNSKETMVKMVSVFWDEVDRYAPEMSAEDKSTLLILNLSQMLSSALEGHLECLSEKDERKEFAKKFMRDALPMILESMGIVKMQSFKNSEEALKSLSTEIATKKTKKSIEDLVEGVKDGDPKLQEL